MIETVGTFKRCREPEAGAIPVLLENVRISLLSCRPNRVGADGFSPVRGNAYVGMLYRVV